MSTDEKMVWLHDLVEPNMLRAAKRAAREGSIPGAVKVGKRWAIRRSDWHAFIASRFGSVAKVDLAALAARDLEASGFKLGR